jgi:hypothetical protein
MRAAMAAMLCLSSVSAMGQECRFRGKPAGAVPVPRQELVDVFVDHTLTTPEGRTFYLAPDGTTKAINEKTGAFGKGHWKIDDRGHVCFQAKFRSGWEDTICKVHLRAPNGQIYNRDFLGPTQELWYCSEAQRGGVFGWTRSGDRVTPRMGAAR